MQGVYTIQRTLYNYLRIRCSTSSGITISVYHYYVSSKQIADTVAKKIQKIVPPNGQISILFITDRQFGMSINYYGGQVVDIECPEQGLLFD